MVQASGVRVPARDAEATRRRLQAAGALRHDLKVARVDGDIVFPVQGEPGMPVASFDFEGRDVPPGDYTDLLPEDLREAAPRAFDLLGDIVIVKVPAASWPNRHILGEALLGFHKSARAVFHDHGVVGAHRTRELERIAGEGASATDVKENGVRLRVDPAKAYYSPRLGDERARIIGLARPGERVIDLFGGVAPLGVQLARAGCDVVSVDLNPDAIALARQNAELNRVALALHCGDARDVAKELVPADRVVMNLPHGARDFLDVAAGLVRPGGMVHVHAIIPKSDIDHVGASIEAALADAGRPARIMNVRHVRDYSAQDAHYCFDVEAT